MAWCSVKALGLLYRLISFYPMQYMCDIYGNNATTFVRGKRPATTVPIPGTPKRRHHLISRWKHHTALHSPLTLHGLAGARRESVITKRVIRNALSTFEELRSQTARLMAPVSNDPKDLNIIIPGYFLNGGRLASSAERGRHSIIQPFSRGPNGRQGTTSC